MDKFNNVVVKRLPRPTSDHCPIHMWMKHHSFFGLLDGWWKNTQTRGWQDMALSKSLKNSKLSSKKVSKKKIVFKERNRDTFGCTKTKKTNLLNELTRIKEMEERLSFDLICDHIRKDIKEEFSTLTFREEIIWWQKCKAKWSLEGDENNQFFHWYMSAQKRKNIVVEILSLRGINLTTDSDIEVEFIDFYQDLYTKRPTNSPFPPNCNGEESV